VTCAGTGHHRSSRHARQPWPVRLFNKGFVICEQTLPCAALDLRFRRRRRRRKRSVRQSGRFRPTFLELAAPKRLTGADGRSLSPLLTGPNSSVWRTTYARSLHGYETNLRAGHSILLRRALVLPIVLFRHQIGTINAHLHSIRVYTVRCQFLKAELTLTERKTAIYATIFICVARHTTLRTDLVTDTLEVRRNRLCNEIRGTACRSARSARYANLPWIPIPRIILSDKLGSTLSTNQGHVIQDVTRPFNVAASIDTSAKFLIVYATYVQHYIPRFVKYI